MGRARCAPVAFRRDGELPGRHAGVVSGGHGEVLRVSLGSGAGIELGSSFVERITVNTGTVSVLPDPAHPVRRVGLGASSADRIGAGGAVVVLRAGESPAHGEGRQRLREGMDAAMPEDAPPNGGAPGPVPAGSWSRVSEMQAKLHRWAAADPGRRFSDLFNFVHDPATLIVAFSRVAGNHGANTPGVDGLTAAYVEEAVGVPGFLEDLRAALKDGSFRPLPVRERKIPKPGGPGKLRKLGIPCIADKVVKAGVLTETGSHEDTHTGTPQGGILSPLIFNVAMSVLDEHLHRPWKPGGSMHTRYLRSRRTVKGLPTWRPVRCADDFVVLVHGTKTDAENLREDVARVLAPMGLRLSAAKTHVVHMSDGFDFLGFRIQWKRKRGTDKWHVCTFIADRPIRSLKAKIRALTNRNSQQDPRSVLIRLGQIMRGWANYFRHAACKRTLSSLSHFV